MIGGEPRFFESIWGIKLSKGDEKARSIIGKSVITSYKLGNEIPYYDGSKGVIGAKGAKIINLPIY